MSLRLRILQPVDATDLETVSLARTYDDYLDGRTVQFLRKAMKFSTVRFYNVHTKTAIDGCRADSYYDKVNNRYVLTVDTMVNGVKFRVSDLGALCVLHSVYEYVLNS